MLTHQSPAIASRYSLPSASTIVESLADTATSCCCSSCLCWTMGCTTLSRSWRTTSSRLSIWADGVGVMGDLSLVWAKRCEPGGSRPASGSLARRGGGVDGPVPASRGRQREADGGPFPQCALDRERPAVGLYEVLDDGQAEAGP